MITTFTVDFNHIGAIIDDDDDDDDDDYHHHPPYESLIRYVHLRKSDVGLLLSSSLLPLLLSKSTIACDPIWVWIACLAVCVCFCALAKVVNGVVCQCVCMCVCVCAQLQYSIRYFNLNCIVFLSLFSPLTLFVYKNG